MTRDTSSGAVVFKCYCGVEERGTAEDALIASDILHSGETAQMYERLISNAAFDRANQQVHRDCPDCGLDYMAQVRVGSREVVVWVCKCGYTSTSTEEALLLAETAPGPGKGP
jgi:hypothetical protein